MGQLLRIVIILLGLWLIIRIVRRALRGPALPHHPSNLPPDTAVLPCAHCGVYIPQSETYVSDGKIYCSREHAKAG